MIDFISWLASLTGALVSLSWKLLLLVGILLLFRYMFQRYRSGGKKPETGSKFGLFQVNRSIVYERKPAINGRRKKGLLGADDVVVTADETEEAETAAATAAAPQGPEATCERPGDEACAQHRARAMASPLPVAVIQVENDVMASQRKIFAKLVDEVIANKDKFSRVIVDASSPGGGVSQYGLMFTEMERLRKDSGLYITGVADEVAASGGMMQLLPVHEIVMPPYAIVGSIGVVTEFLNFNKFLTDIGITPIEITAGDLKRTVTQFGEPTEAKIAHYKEQLRRIHRQFIASVQKYRHVNPDLVCNGDHWTAQEAFAQGLGLVDRLGTSRGLLFEANQDHDLIILSENASRWEKGVFRFLTRILDWGIHHVMTKYGPFGQI